MENYHTACTYNTHNHPLRPIWGVEDWIGSAFSILPPKPGIKRSFPTTIHKQLYSPHFRYFITFFLAKIGGIGFQPLAMPHDDKQGFQYRRSSTWMLMQWQFTMWLGRVCGPLWLHAAVSTCVVPGLQQGLTSAAFGCRTFAWTLGDVHRCKHLPT